MMRNKRVWLYIGVFILLLVGLFFFVRTSEGIFDAYGKKKDIQELSDLQTELSKKDYKIFWIGEVPDSILAMNLKLVQIRPNSISEDTMPFRVRERMVVEQIETDGVLRHKYTQSLTEGETAINTFIVINNVQSLTDEDYQLITRCINQTGSVLYILDSNSVISYEEYLLLPASSQKCDNMRVTSNQRKKNFIAQDIDSSANESGAQFTNEWIEALLEDFILMSSN